MDSSVAVALPEAPGPNAFAAWRTMARFTKQRLATVAQAKAAYGDVARYAFAGYHFYFVQHPDVVHEILVSKGRSFRKDPYYFFLRLALGEGLLTSEGGFHLRQRRMIQPAFHKERIRGYGETMVRCASAMADGWAAGESIDINAAMSKLALDIVGKTLFSSDVADASELVAHTLEELMALEDWYTNPLGPTLARIGWLPPNRKKDRLLATLNAVLYRMIDEHRQSGDQGDLLSMLLAARDEDDGTGMTDQQVRDEALTLFLAGHETTALALTYAWYEIARNPEVEAALHAEVDAVLGGRLPTAEDYPQLPYTYQVFAETMRLHPPAYMIGRQPIEDVELGGYRVPKDSIVVLCQYAVHRDPRFWPDPERFDPARFAPEARTSRPKFAYFPFGGGQRLCVGEPFAWMEGVLVLAAIAQRWRVRIDPATQLDYNCRVTLRLHGGMQATLEPRVGSPVPAAPPMEATPV